MKLKHYFYSQFGATFFPIFLGLFFITSIIFLVRIASWTSIIQMNFYELVLLYVYAIPNILFYTLPIAFFVSLVITLSKLSSEYELIVVTSFGLDPKRILYLFLPLTFFISLSLLIISLGLIPKTKNLTNQFYESKKKEANFNIKASEFGQTLGDWLIYITQKKDKTFKDVKLFQTKEGVDQFIIAKDAEQINEGGNLSFKLNDGKSFHIENDVINQIDYVSMYINDSLKTNSGSDFKDSITYWKQKLESNSDLDKMTFYILTSLFPLLSPFLVIAFGFLNPRYEKNRSVAWAVFSVVLFYVFSDFVTKKMLLNALYIVPFFWVIFTYFLYQKKVAKIY